MPQGPVKASHEFSVIRRASSLESIPTEESRPAAKVDVKVKRHKRSNSVGTSQLNEKFIRSFQRERNMSPASPSIHGGLHNIRDALYRNSGTADSYINPSVPVFGMSHTRSLDCLFELENLTLSHSPATPHEGHKAPLPHCACRRCSQTPDDSPILHARSISPGLDSPDAFKIGSSPRVNCSFLFAQQPPATAATATCTRGSLSSLDSLETSAPDKSKIKISFSNNSLFNRPAGGATCVAATRRSPAEQTCQ